MESMTLWNDIPGYVEGGEIPCLRYYPASERRGRGSVLIFPGGGYQSRAKHEGEGYALFLNSEGLDAFVLDYRVAPTRYPYALMDARRAMRYIRSRAEELGLDPEHIAVMGSSAGGHLAAHLATLGDKPLAGEPQDSLSAFSARPTVQLLCYPVTSPASHIGSYKNLLGEDWEACADIVDPYLLADGDTPPAFIWHTETDRTVDPAQTLRYAARLHELGVRCELHLYPEGPHGIGLAESYPSARRWTRELIFYLEGAEFFAPGDKIRKTLSSEGA